ncbi:4'-phosphopantetheinyl transferase superfamily protein [Herbiconiux moechotypicola]|uniref:4'-phosphopantetheinyl transferase family protein n=1 Tax=Herbiconiux moechotypicola TaxID=637393 RepID=UPI00217E5197|nr:4'-phosphopantetheinyl transferase superfamily protein [Herbiconiux moechotypicola]MCS5729595.1 4'-phosphopantetheinyl transferase superfamily protein [Herbiconiux moechotypicola]
MNVARPPEVWLGVSTPEASRDDDHLAVETSTARILALPDGSVRLSHQCPTCGATDHGRPELRSTHAGPGPGALPLTVSLSRTDGGSFWAVASGADALGIDLESTTAVARAPIDSVAFTADELADLERGAAARDVDHLELRTAAWTIKEALLKAAGTGLRADPRALRLTWAPRSAPPPVPRPGVDTLDPPWEPFPAFHLEAVPPGSAIDPSRTHLRAFTRHTPHGTLVAAVAVVTDLAPRLHR